MSRKIILSLLLVNQNDTRTIHNFKMMATLYFIVIIATDLLDFLWSWTRKWQRELFENIKAMQLLLFATCSVESFLFYSPSFYVRDFVKFRWYIEELRLLYWCCVALTNFLEILVYIFKNNACFQLPSRTYNYVFVMSCIPIFNLLWSLLMFVS